MLGARRSLPAAAEMSSGTSFTKPSQPGGLGAGEAPCAASQGSIQPKHAMQECKAANGLAPHLMEKGSPKSAVLLWIS